MSFSLPDPAFWRDKRVLLTGHTGFKGAWALYWLSRMGADVTGLALAPDTDPALFDLLGGAALGRHHVADVRDAGAVQEIVAAARPQIVLHMAAQPIVRRSITDPCETIDINVMGVANLLSPLRTVAGLEAVVVITSDKVYANDERGRAFEEGDRLGGKDPYSASKAAAELVTQSFRQTYFADAGVPVATARCGNIIGGGDFAADRIVPDVVRAAAAGETLVLRHPDATRPWLHVLDGVCGYLVYAEQLAGGAALPAALNFGPDPEPELPVRRVADLMQSALGASGGWRHEPVPGSKEMKALAVDSTLARAALGWRDRIRGDDRIVWTADWHKAQRDGAEPRRICDRQLDAFLTL